VIRLYPAEEFYRRPEFDVPEIFRKELSSLVLDCAAMGVRKSPGCLGSMRRQKRRLPRPRRFAPVESDGCGRLYYSTGREMSRLPLHPRLGRLVVEAKRRDAGEDGCAIAALLSASARLPARQHSVTHSDLLVLLESGVGGAIPAAVPTTVSRGFVKSAARADAELDLLQSILTAFPDRISKRRKGSEEVLLCGGGSALLAESSTVRQSELHGRG